MVTRESIILFTRFPEPGKVKTRLIDTLGAQGAADLHKSMTEQTLQRIRPVLTQRQTQLLIYYSGNSQSAMLSWLGSDSTVCRQQGTDLGERMEHAFAQVFSQGIQQAVLIGTDCPGLTGKIISSGLETLKKHSLVLGPAVDGGYYLIGLCRPDKTTLPGPSILFNTIDWGSEHVLQQTVTRARNTGLSYALLPKLHDIDRPEDLVHLDHHTCS